ncbi:MAG: hypothetical protein JO006_11030 [Paucibacter sp.]|nr:hypothetical protein [Roseateles sp.]
MLVRIEKDWGYPDFRRQSRGFSATWDGIRFTDEPVRDCDLLVVFNSPVRDIRVNCPPGNRWLFTQESPIEMYRWHTDSFKYFDRVFTYWGDEISPNIEHEQTSLPWHVGRSYDQLMALGREEALAAKVRNLSWVTSNATHKEGHKLRMALKSHLESSGMPFDLFGRGFSPIADKFDGIFPYKYSLAIENYRCADYWTEKIADCFLSWTMPVYWGASNIRDYFPAEAMLEIDPGDPVAALRVIQEAIQSGRYERGLDAIAHARDLVLNKYQLFPHIVQLLSQREAPSLSSRQAAFIPAHPHHYKNETRLGMVRRLVKRQLLKLS